MRVGIIGAGLGGLTLAQRLSRDDADVEVFERDASPYMRRQGFRITVDDDGFGALRSCLPPELFAMIDATSGPPGGHFRITDERLRDAVVVDFDPAVAAERQVDREVLRAILLLGMEDRVHWSAPVDGVVALPDGCRIEIGGRSEEFDAVVIADGIGSPLRAAVYPDATPVRLGVGGIYGRAPLRIDGQTLLPERLHDSGILAMLPKPNLAFFATAMRFTEAPARVMPGETIPPGLAALGDYVMWGLIPDPARTDELRELGPEELLSTAEQLTVGLSPILANLVAQSGVADTLFSRFAAGRPGGARAIPRATVIGDAIHPMPPLGAHGGNTALRSAAAIGDRLLAATPITAAIDAYESEMVGYATATIAAAEKQTTRLTNRGMGTFMLRRVLPLLRRQAS